MHIGIDKADPSTEKKAVPDIIIEIVKKLPLCKTLQETEIHYERQAELIEKALHTSLPQGVYDRLIIKFMTRKTSDLTKDLAELRTVCHTCGCITLQNHRIKEMSTRNGKYLCKTCNKIEEQISKNMNRLSA